MNDLFNKISSYNIFTNLLPGLLFVVIIKIITPYSFFQQDIILDLFLYYFFGLVISRFGSLIIEPFLENISFIKKTEYKDYVVALKKDSKIENLLESRNVYRSLVSLFVILCLFKIYSIVELIFPWITRFNIYILILFLLILFIFSYKKQNNYISSRINAIK